jgi:two-component system sensor histidine kinase KdpD
MTRGRLRVYVGAVPGVGKTYAALEEIHDLAEGGVDAVVGLAETRGRPETEALLTGLEVLPYRSAETAEGPRFAVEIEALLERAPRVAFIDDIAHRNAPGAVHPRRWQDIEELLEAGMDVISSVSILELESLRDVVEEITGTTASEAIPDEILKTADEIHLVDFTHQVLRDRLAAGKIVPAEAVDARLTSLFRAGNLTALRELALSWTADRVDEIVGEYRRRHGIDSPWETKERVVVGLTGEPGGDDTIRRAARIAMRSRGELLGVHVRTAELAADESDLARQRQLVERLGGRYHEVTGPEVGEALLAFARANNGSQLVLGSTRRTRLRQLLGGSVIQDVLRHSRDIDVHVISRPPGARRIEIPRVPAPLPRRRRLWGWVVAMAGFLGATVILLDHRRSLGLENVLLIYLSIAAVTAWIGGLWPALVAAVIGFLLGNYLFTPPFGTWTIAEGEDVLALAMFLFLAGLIGVLVGAAARRSAEATTAKAEAETLAGLIGDSSAGSPQKLIERLQVALDARGVALLLPVGSGFEALAAAGPDPPAHPLDSDRVRACREAFLAVSGGPLDSVDERLLSATVAELSAMMDRATLARDASRVESLGRANDLRTALLRAVSHDLRSPLSAIQASVTSLLQDDVVWPASDQRRFLDTIDEESERLNRVVSDLLDAGRLQAGAVEPRRRAAGIEEVVSAVATTFRSQHHRLEIEVSELLPDIHTDPALLERIVENLVRNALEHSPPNSPVRISADRVGSRMLLRVVDRGPGIDPDMRQQVFEPFRTLGDGRLAGVGLGLSVARGLADALGHELEVEDTPGGGTTMVLVLGLHE